MITLPTETMVEVSTGHILPADADLLSGAHPGVIVYEYEEGYFIS